jgi:hypothetical protein
LLDSAKSCEYLTSEKLCLAVSENEESKASRQIQCKNPEKLTCCYLCMFVLGCATPCQFSGSNENDLQQIDNKVTPIHNTAVAEQKPKEETKTENAPVTCCSACSVEMLQSRTKFVLDEKSTKDNSRQFGAKELPVIVYSCPKCGKIDLKVEEKQDKN